MSKKKELEALIFVSFPFPSLNSSHLLFLSPHRKMTQERGLPDCPRLSPTAPALQGSWAPLFSSLQISDHEWGSFFLFPTSNLNPNPASLRLWSLCRSSIRGLEIYLCSNNNISNNHLLLIICIRTRIFILARKISISGQNSRYTKS